MSKTITIGGNRLGSGKKMTTHLREYERSTHDMSYIWRSTMAAGTLVPFLNEVGLPGDTFDIDLNANIMTHPTIGPLFGSYKVQLDIFLCPIRLYIAELHNNQLGVGNEMSSVKLPQVLMKAKTPSKVEDLDNGQINPSCIWSYLNIRGLGVNPSGVGTEVQRRFNATNYIAYWDIVKNYYANKQEEIAYVIHRNVEELNNTLINNATLTDSTGEVINITESTIGTAVQKVTIGSRSAAVFNFVNKNEVSPESISIWWNGKLRPLNEIFKQTTWTEGTVTGKLTAYNAVKYNEEVETGWFTYDQTAKDMYDAEPQLVPFDLKNIDQMRTNLLRHLQSDGAFIIDETTIAPYGLSLKSDGDNFSKLSSQEGLAVKTYQSDLFNNWLLREAIDGDNGVNDITRIDTTQGYFNIDTLNLSKKVYDLLNRVNMSGGTYDDWLDAAYTHERRRSITTPMYMGGLIKELVFQEVVSNAESGEGENQQPLGTLAGRGVLAKKHKGGTVKVKVDEPSVIMGIASLTPRIDYSQGNKWDVNLKTMDDFHKPALDQIGFQDLITEQMAWWDTTITSNPNTPPNYLSAGKQPAWINYMTNVNIIRGNFAVKTEQMFMVLDRRFDTKDDLTDYRIKDLTTYIDPSKFNHIFADTRRDAQNFWTQISVDMDVRRKMSAKVIPNL